MSSVFVADEVAEAKDRVVAFVSWLVLGGAGPFAGEAGEGPPSNEDLECCLSPARHSRLTFRH